MSKIATGIAKKIGQPDIIEKITQELSLSELSSFLLEEKTSNMSEKTCPRSINAIDDACYHEQSLFRIIT